MKVLGCYPSENVVPVDPPDEKVPDDVNHPALDYYWRCHSPDAITRGFHSENAVRNREPVLHLAETVNKRLLIALLHNSIASPKRL